MFPITLVSTIPNHQPTRVLKCFKHCSMCFYIYIMLWYMVIKGHLGHLTRKFCVEAIKKPFKTKKKAGCLLHDHQEPRGKNINDWLSFWKETLKGINGKYTSLETVWQHQVLHWSWANAIGLWASVTSGPQGRPGARMQGPGCRMHWGWHHHGVCGLVILVIVRVEEHRMLPVIVPSKFKLI